MAIAPNAALASRAASGRPRSACARASLAMYSTATSEPATVDVPSSGATIGAGRKDRSSSSGVPIAARDAYASVAYGHCLRHSLKHATAARSYPVRWYVLPSARVMGSDRDREGIVSSSASAARHSRSSRWHLPILNLSSASTTPPPNPPRDAGGVIALPSAP